MSSEGGDMNIKYNQSNYSSPEEVMFVYWLEEAHSVGFVSEFKHGPELECVLHKGVTTTEIWDAMHRVLRSTKAKPRYVARKRTYTPDFVFQCTEKFIRTFPVIPVNGKCGLVINKNMRSLVDVKGAGTSFHRQTSPGGGYVIGKNADMARRRMQLVQALMWDRYREFVNVFTPAEWFKYTFVPDRMRYTDWNFWVQRKTSPARKLRKKRDGSPFWAGYRRLIDLPGCYSNALPHKNITEQGDHGEH
jgi:hypothetical protein